MSVQLQKSRRSESGAAGWIFHEQFNQRFHREFAGVSCNPPIVCLKFKSEKIWEAVGDPGLRDGIFLHQLHRGRGFCLFLLILRESIDSKNTKHESKIKFWLWFDFLFLNSLIFSIHIHIYEDRHSGLDLKCSQPRSVTSSNETFRFLFVQLWYCQKITSKCHTCYRWN